MARIPVIIPDEHYEYLRELAHIKRSSMSEEVRNAIAAYVSKVGQEEEYRHIKIEMENDPLQVRLELDGKLRGGQ